MPLSRRNAGHARCVTRARCPAWPGVRNRNRAACSRVQQQIPGLLGGPGAVGVRGHAQGMHMASADLEDEDHVPAAQGERAVDGEEVARDHGRGLGAQELLPGGAAALQAGGIRSRLRALRTVQAPTRMPRPSSSPWIACSPRPGFCRAIGSISMASFASIVGLPTRWRVVQRQQASRRCQASSVSGVTSRLIRSGLGGSMASAASTARPGQSGFGCGFCRRSTATSWRNTSCSASFEAGDRVSRAIQPAGRTKTR